MTHETAPGWCRPIIARLEGAGNDRHKPLTVTHLQQLFQHLARVYLYSEDRFDQAMQLHQELCARLVREHVAEAMLWCVM